MKKLLALAFLGCVMVAPVVVAEPPEQSGPYVFRYHDVLAVYFSDPDSGLGMSIGADPVEFCEGTINFDVVPVQDIMVPEDANRINRTLTGKDVRASVWPFTAFDCNLFTTIDPVGTGTVDVRLTDNDVNIFLNPDSYNWNAFGFRAHGLFGRGIPVVGRQNCLWDGHNDDTFRCVTKIAIKD